MPNITGDIQNMADVTTLSYPYHHSMINNCGSSLLQHGAIYGFKDTVYGNHVLRDIFEEWNNIRYYGIGFDASKSNLIYGKSDTVQPQSMTVNYYIKVK